MALKRICNADYEELWSNLHVVVFWAVLIAFFLSHWYYLMSSVKEIGPLFLWILVGEHC